MRAVRVVFADEGSGARARTLDLAERCGFEIVGEAVSWDDVGSLCRSRAADVVLVGGSADYAAGARALDLSIPTIALAPDARAAKEFTSAGVSAVVSLDGDPDLLTATAQIVLENAKRLAEARAEALQLRDALETRKVVERAKGVLMQRLGVTEDVAYRRMQRASQEENRKMRDIAESILRAERVYAAPQEPL